MRCFLVRALVGAFLVLICCPTGADPPILDLKLTEASEDILVEFDVGRAMVLSDPSLDLDREFAARTATYRLIADLSEVKFHIDFQLRYRFPVYVLRLDGTEAYRYQVDVEPLRLARDSALSVTFRIGEDDSWQKDEFRIPVYSASPASYVVVESSDEPVDVRLGDEIEIPVRLVNSLPDLTTWIDIEEEVDGSSAWSYLRPAPVKGAEGRMELRADSGADLILQGRLKEGAALMRGIWPSKEESHDTLTAHISYATLGGKPVRDKLEVKVRFVPSLAALLGALLVGVVLAKVCLLLRHGTGWRDWLRDLSLAAVLSLVLWWLAVGLYVADSRISFFGADLDPWGVPGAALIGIAAGLAASPILDFLQRLASSWSGSEPVTDRSSP